MKLWKEYAIEPTLFSNYHLGSEILSGIGIEHGRLVGAVPRKWEQKVRKAIVHHTVMQKHRIVQRMAEVADAITPRIGAWDGERAWTEQVLEYHTALPFDGILIDGNSNHPETKDASLGMTGVGCWHSARSLTIPRTAESLANALRPLVRNARTILIIDPYFNPVGHCHQSKWLRPLTALSSTFALDGRITRLEVHALNSRSGNNQWRQGTFSANSAAYLGAALPRPLSITATLWSERPGGEQFHERSIITDTGGVVLEPGFDDGPVGEIYTLRLMDKREAKRYREEKFVQATSPYSQLEKQIVQGTCV